MDKIISSTFLFIFAGLCEVGGGYLVWQAIRGGKPFYFSILGGIALILYGIIPTFQPSHFGRVYAAYGGVFVVISLLWGWRFDNTKPDVADLVGASLCLLGVAIMMYWPRNVAL